MRIVWLVRDSILRRDGYARWISDITRCFRCKYSSYQEPMEASIDLLYCHRRKQTIWSTMWGYYHVKYRLCGYYRINPEFKDDYQAYLNLEKEIRAQCGYGPKIVLSNNLSIII